MRKTLADIFTAAHERDCPIVHISGLAGQAPFIAGNPCLGNTSVPLVDITPDDYLAIMAELRNRIVVEHDETLAFLIFTGGARDPQAPKTGYSSHRVRSPAPLCRRSDGAVYYMLDSAGQETTIIYNGLETFEDIQAYWRRRGELVRALQRLRSDRSGRTRPVSSARPEYPTRYVDIHAFARGRGLTKRLQHDVAS